MKAEKSFNNPATLTVEATVRRDHNQVMITLKDTKSIRIFKVFMTKAEAKELGLDLYKISDGQDLEEPPPPYDETDFINHVPEHIETEADDLDHGNPVDSSGCGEPMSRFGK